MSNVLVRVTLFNKVGVCKGIDSYASMKGQVTKMLLCLAVHAAVSNQWQLDRLNIARCVFSDFYDEDLEARRASLNVSATALRNALTRGRENPLLYDKHSEKYTLDRQHIAVDAHEFRQAFDDARKAQNLDERIEQFLIAVAKSEGELDDMGITCQRFLVEYNRLKSWQCDARYQLALCYEERRNTHDALEYARKALEIDPGAPDVRDLEKRLKKLQTVPAGTPKCLNSLPPYSSSFVSRDKDVAEIVSLLHQARLVTVTGPGGCGKTRLLLHVTADMHKQFLDGVWFVDLAPLADPTLVMQAVAQVLDVNQQAEKPLQQTLIEHLATKELLLLLDNCEHLLSECSSLITVLLRSCPTIKVMATSREKMGVSGEQTFLVPSLTLPALKPPLTAEYVNQYEAVQLFQERARQAKHSFVITNDNAYAVAQICCRLDGIPLAIELAAAWVRSLTPEDINAKMSNCLPLLKGGDRTALPRYKTMRDSIRWSYDLLEPQEKLLLSRLSVFAGGWTLSAAEQVCSGEGTDDNEVLDLLTYLVDKSLVVAEVRSDSTRYRLLETIREFAMEKITEGEAESLRKKHAKVFLSYAEKAANELEGQQQRDWYARLDVDYDNLRAALNFCLLSPENVEQSVKFGEALRIYWIVRGHVSEGEHQLNKILALTEAMPQTLTRSRVVRSAGLFAKIRGDYERAHRLFEEWLSIGHFLSDQKIIAGAYHNLGSVAMEQGDIATAERLLEQALAINIKEGNEDWEASDRDALGEIARLRGDYPKAIEYYEGSLAIRRKQKNELGISNSVKNLGHVALHQCQFEIAHQHYTESLRTKIAVGDVFGYPRVLEAFAALAHAQQRPERSVHLYAAARIMRSKMRVVPTRSEKEAYDNEMADLQTLLGKDTFEAADKVGRSLTDTQALELGIEDEAEKTVSHINI